MNETPINLLPPEKKRRLEALVQFLLARNILGIALFFTSILAIVYVFGWWLVHSPGPAGSSEGMLVNPSANTYNQTARALNNLIRQSWEATVGYAPLEGRVRELAASAPPGIVWQSLTIDRRAGTLMLTGQAATRDGLLQLEQAARALPWLANVTLPLSQLLSQNDINFRLSAALQDLPPLRSEPAAAK